MNAQEINLAEWIIGTLGTDARTAAVIACSYTPDELEDIEYIKNELLSWRNGRNMLMDHGILKFKY